MVWRVVPVCTPIDRIRTVKIGSVHGYLRSRLFVRVPRATVPGMIYAERKLWQRVSRSAVEER